MSVWRFAAPILAILVLAGPAAAQPAPERPAAACTAQPADLTGARSYTYRHASGRDLRLHVFAPDKPAPSRAAIAFFFGGGWRQGDVRAFAPQAQVMADHGLAAVLVDYRVTCRDQTTAVDSLADAEAAYAWLQAHAKDLGIDPKRIALAGGSAGGHLALATAMRAKDKPAALALFNPAVDIVAIAPAIGLAPETARSISPSALPAAGLPPMIAFHGRADRTVPIQTVRDLCARAAAAGRRCELVEYDAQAHGFFHKHAVDPVLGFAPYDDTVARSVAFLQQLGLAR